MSENLMEMFIGDQIAFTYRAYTPAKNQIGLFAQDCSVEYHHIRFLEEG